MALTPTQLEELSTIADELKLRFPDNGDNVWDAAIRILNANLGPSAGGSVFTDTLDDLQITAAQISIRQSRLGIGEAFNPGIAQVIPIPEAGGGGGGGDNYYSANLAGTEARLHTHTGATTVQETYDDSGGSGDLTDYQKGPGSFNVGSTGGAGNDANLEVNGGTGNASLDAAGPNGQARVAMVDGAIQIVTETMSVSITDGSPAAGLQEFADDAAAQLGGLQAGDLYQTDGNGAAPLNVAGIVMIRRGLGG